MECQLFVKDRITREKISDQVLHFYDDFDDAYGFQDTYFDDLTLVLSKLLLVQEDDFLSSVLNIQPNVSIQY